jgi:hypothetical protein
MNSYDVTGKSDSCPNCGSENVRWRGRRWYDVPLNFIRYVIEAFFHTLGFGAKAPSQYAPEFSQYLEQQKIYDDRMSAQTPSRFWKCAACKQRGEVFDDLGGEDRSALAETRDKAMDYYYRQNDNQEPPSA